MVNQLQKFDEVARHIISISLFSSVFVIAPVNAGDLDRYQYVLEKGKEQKVCRHMHQVYTKYFASPWKRPPLPPATVATGDYGPQSPYAFSRLPGIVHDSRMTFEMSYSRLPTSPEFEAIQWREGRFRFVAFSG